MLYYGFNNIFKLLTINNNNKKTKTKINFNRINFKIFIPFNFNFIVYKKLNIQKINYIYIYTNSYYQLIPVFTILNNFFFDKNSNSCLISFKYANNFYKLYWHFFKNIYNSFFSWFSKKIKFKGKGYYIFKNLRNSIALKFGYSHRMYIFMNKVNVKFLSKTSVLLFGLNLNEIIKKSFEFYYTRTHNIFTGKGVRFAKQIIYRKAGKISSFR